MEEGEVKDPSDRKVRPRPTCRFFMKGNTVPQRGRNPQKLLINGASGILSVTFLCLGGQMLNLHRANMQKWLCLKCGEPGRSKFRRKTCSCLCVAWSNTARAGLTVSCCSELIPWKTKLLNTRYFSSSSCLAKMELFSAIPYPSHFPSQSKAFTDLCKLKIGLEILFLCKKY